MTRRQKIVTKIKLFAFKAKLYLASHLTKEEKLEILDMLKDGKLTNAELKEVITIILSAN